MIIKVYIYPVCTYHTIKRRSYARDGNRKRVQTICPYPLLTFKYTLAAQSGLNLFQHNGISAAYRLRFSQQLDLILHVHRDPELRCHFVVAFLAQVEMVDLPIFF